MLERPTTPTREKDQGFTLIELLVVVLIIGILAAIAIPVFLSQREKAADSATKSDLKNAATVMETWFVDEQTYGPKPADAAAANAAQFKDLRTSDGVTVTIETASVDAFCLSGANTGGRDEDFYYNSATGGLTDDPCTP